MKKLFLIIFFIGILLWLFIFVFFNRSKFTAEFASDIYVKYKYENSNIYTKINDDKDFGSLKFLLNGIVYKDNPACGFSLDVSITLSSNKKNIILCPALDGCPIIRIGETDTYFKMSEENWEKLNQILRKYDVKLPSI